MRKTFVSTLCGLLWLCGHAQQKMLLRQPAINNDGTMVAFSFQGDIWTVTAAGGKATRLTVHEAYETKPVFSPDGKQIAFSGARFGNNDIFVMPVQGGQPKRLTFHSNADIISSWTQPDNIVFSTSREFKQIERPAEVYSISPKGGTESRMMDVVGWDPTISPDGRFVAFVRGDINPVARLAYKGSSDRNIWLYDIKNKTYTQLPGFATNDILPQWGSNNNLYFLSSIDGAYNLYKLKVDAVGKGSTPEKLTNFKDESIRSFAVSADGTSIVFEQEMDLYTMKTDKGSPKRLDVSISADDRLDATEQKTFTAGATDVALSPNGKMLAYTVRGEIFVKEADKEKTRSINVSNSPYRDQDPVWLNDSTLLFCSDRKNGNFDMYMARSLDTTERSLYRSLKQELVQITQTNGDEGSPVISPDGKKIAYVRGRGAFIVADISAAGKMTNEKILGDSWASPNGVTWSPDSKWLAYSITDLYTNVEVYIQPADNSSKPVNVSMHPRTDRSPFWSADGSKLGFLSERSSNKSMDVYFVWLKKEDWEKESQDWQDRDPQVPDVPASTKTAEKKSSKPLKIDFDKIYERVVQVTSFSGDESDLNISKDGETFYYTTSTSSAKGRDLYSIKWDGRDLKEITKGGTNPGNVTMDRDGKYLYYTKQGGSLGRINIATTLPEPLPYLAKMKIDYAAEREQVFEEAWRTIRDGYYDPKFHGHDWGKLHDKYKERTVGASTSTDFGDMFNLMLGEVNSSHMGFTTTDRSETQKDATGLIGAELMAVDGGMQVKHVVPETPADRANSKLEEGDVITAVNGQAVVASDNFYEMLNGLTGEKVLLSIKTKEAKTKEVVMRLTTSIANNLYNEWVAQRKKMVDRYSNGRLGYIHIKSMDVPSFEIVEREFTAAGFGKDGLVIDVRYNGGGSTTDMLMTILNYKQHAYTIPRGASEDLEKDKLKFRDYYPIGERLVYAAWTKPSIALCNEGSYSNAEIFSHAYKTLGIGKLVGVPTNGSVISTGAKSLMDGSSVRLPGRGWYVKATDKNEELGPAVPDIIVENEIDWTAKGTDTQLQTAVKELLKELDVKK